MPRMFNTAGPCDSTDHYMLPAVARLPDVMQLIQHKLYFVLLPSISRRSRSL